MALKSINGGGKKFITADETVTTTSIEVGSSIEGYLLSIDSYTDKDGLPKTPMYIQRRDGVVLRVFVSGNLKYMIQDGKFTLGQYTQITRLEDKKVKGGKMSSMFDAAQDDEDIVNLDEVLDALYKKSAANYAAKKDAAKTGGTVTSGMTKSEQKRNNLAQKAKLLD